jgi:hypothetical protein
MFSLLGIGTNVVFVLYSHTRVDLGGMGRSVITLSFDDSGLPSPSSDYEPVSPRYP